MINREDIDRLEISDEEISALALEVARLIEGLGLADSAGYKNLNALKDYTVKTREMFRALQEENQRYTTQIRQQNIVLERMKEQIQQLQVNFITLKNATG